MSKSRMINTSIWDDDYFADLSPEEKLSWFYLLTNPSAEMKPFFQLPSKKLSNFRLGVDFQAHLKKFASDDKIRMIDDYVFLTNWGKHQSLNANHKTGIKKAFDELPDTIKACFLNDTHTLVKNSEVKALDGMGNPSPTHPHPLPIEPPTYTNNSTVLYCTELNSTVLNSCEEGVIDDLALGFSEFYQLYPKQVGFELAMSYYTQLIKNNETTHKAIYNQLLEDIDDLRATELKFVSDPVNWLKKKLWLKHKPKPQPILPEFDEFGIYNDPEKRYEQITELDNQQRAKTAARAKIDHPNFVNPYPAFSL